MDNPQTASDAPIGRQADIVDLAICVVSGVGSLIIIIPYIASSHSRKLRHSLIFGLASADLVANLSIITSTAYLVDGRNFNSRGGARFCTFLGYTLSSGVYAQHMWNFAILCITYMILVHPLSSVTLLLERRVMWLWPIIWTVAMSLNAIPWTLVGFTYSSGYCYIGRNTWEGPSLSSLFQLIPRSIVVVSILILYTRLFFFLRRENLFKKTGGRSAPESSVDSSTSARDPEIAFEDQRSDSKNLHSNTNEEMRGRAYLPFLRRGSVAASAAGKSGSGSEPLRGVHRGRNGVDQPPSMELQDYGFLTSAAGTPKSLASTNEKLPSLTARAEKTLAGSVGGPQTSEVRRSSSVSDPRESNGEKSTMSPTEWSETQVNGITVPSLLLGSSPLSTTEGSSQTAGESSQHSSSSIDKSLLDSQAVLGGSDARKSLDEKDGNDTDDDDDSIPDYHSWAGLKTTQPLRRARDFNMASSPREGVPPSSPHSSASPHMTSVLDALRTGPPVSKKAALMLGGQSEGQRGSSTAPDRDIAVAIEEAYGRNTNEKHNYNVELDDSFIWGQNVTAGGQQSRRGSLMPESGNKGRNTSVEGRKQNRGHLASKHSESHASGVEDTGSTLNRQASALLLLYPLAYLILFSVSMIRLIRDLINPAYLNNPRDPLRTVARWMIFAQGALDCIIFKVIEQQFRRRMKRRRAIARGEEVKRSQPESLGLKVKDCLVKIWNRHVRPKPEGSRRPSLG